MESVLYHIYSASLKRGFGVHKDVLATNSMQQSMINQWMFYDTVKYLDTYKVT